MKLKLLFVVNVDWFFLSHRLPIALEALRQGYEVHIATTFTDKTKALQDQGFVTHHLTLDRSGSGLWTVSYEAWQIYRLFKDVKPDVVHLVTIKPVLFGGVVARFARVPAVVSAISGLGLVFVAKGLKATVRRWMVTSLYRWALGHHNQKVIFQNPDDLTYLARHAHLSNRKVIIIRGSGVDLSHYRVTPFSSGAPVILFAARLLVDKGIREFVQSSQILRQRGLSAKDARFVIVGKPDAANPASLCADELAQWAENNLVELWGYRTDMPQVIGAAHLVVLPSYYGEGLPKVLIEAAACGRAVITTDHPGCRYAIEPNKTGLIVPIKNALALAEAIEYLIKNADIRERMGASGRAFAEKEFAIEKTVTEHMEIYKKLLDKVSFNKIF